jgi:serine/threonine-protein kinase
VNCPSCQAQNDDAAETCFTCGRSLTAVIKRGSIIASRYEILNPLGKGGMGMVYKAHDRVLEETIAVKVLRADIARSPDMARRFRSEIRLARKVTHKNVCRIHEYGEEQGLRYISMELIEGVDVKNVMRERRGGLPTEEAFDVAIQVAKGLQAIHEVGIVHRDLKTANIMRDAKGTVKLMDFGIAKQEGSGGATATGDIVGTPEYMSPEQARGQKVDARSDIYALGIVIYEIFSGDVPFRGDTPIITIFKHIQDQPLFEGPGAPPFPAPLVAVLRKALAKDPAERYATAREVADALRQARSEAIPHAISGAHVVSPVPLQPPAERDFTPAPAPSAYAMGDATPYPGHTPLSMPAARPDATPAPPAPTPPPGPITGVPVPIPAAVPAALSSPAARTTAAPVPAAEQAPAPAARNLAATIRDEPPVIDLASTANIEPPPAAVSQQQPVPNRPAYAPSPVPPVVQRAPQQRARPAPPPPTPPPQRAPAPPTDSPLATETIEAPEPEAPRAPRPQRQPTQRLRPAEATAAQPARRPLWLLAVPVAVVVVGAAGVFLVGRFLRSRGDGQEVRTAEVESPGKATTGAESAGGSGKVGVLPPRPRVEEVNVPVPPTAAPSPSASVAPFPAVPATAPPGKTLATPAPAPSAAPTLAAPSPTPQPVPTAAPTVAAPTPRPATPLPTPVAPAPGPQVQIANLLREADAALGAQRYEDAVRQYDEVLKLDSQNTPATGGKAKAQWAASAARKGFAPGAMINEPKQKGKGPAGFEDVDVRGADFLCDIGIEIAPATVRLGADLGYRARITLMSTGRKAIKIKEVTATPKVDGKPEPSRPVPASVREVAPNKRETLGEAAGTWVEGMKQWALDVAVVGDKGDVCRRSLNWK